MGELSVIVIHIYMGSLVFTLSCVGCDTIQSPTERICECVLSTKCQLGIGHINISIHLSRRISLNIWYLFVCVCVTTLKLTYGLLSSCHPDRTAQYSYVSHHQSSRIIQTVMPMDRLNHVNGSHRNVP